MKKLRKLAMQLSGEKHSHRREQPVQRLGVFEEQQGWQCVWSRETGMGNEERGAGHRGLGNRVPAKC